MTRIGVDVGSTTAKLVAIDNDGKILFSRYRRHNAKAAETVGGFLQDLKQVIGDTEVAITMTGSVGMGFSERCSLPFVQEVVAAAKAIQANYPQVKSMIDIGGEDAKVVFFKDGKAADLRMNGNCAGGTGAFIDQMAVLLGADISELDKLALQAERIYPIASRCGVFCKTDIQNLVARNACREDIAASIFHAVAVQTVVTLAHGFDITPPLLFCGGPLTFIPALRKAFTDYLSITENDIIIPDNGALIPAMGAALACNEECCGERKALSKVISEIEDSSAQLVKVQSGLHPIFSGQGDFDDWNKRISGFTIKRKPLKEGKNDVLLGIDSGSTTTKITVIDENKNLLFSYYDNNGGNPINAVEKGLVKLKEECTLRNAELNIIGSCSTGYGEDLIKAAFQLNSGIIETIAHYLSARNLDPDVSFILDIGGQDMKAIFVDNGVIDRMEINEACSSGCGSFIETFAKTLGYKPSDFSKAACGSSAPSDLGTRCTVFMNSKVKQALREGASINDIAAGLAYSVVKNCLYKVLKLKDASALGSHIVVQGGTMRNNAVVRALELLTGAEVRRCDIPELMGAFGCALYANSHRGEALSLDDILNKAVYTAKTLNCKGCHNQCLVTRYKFENGGTYFSGNKCERVFTNGGKGSRRGANPYTRKNELLFNRTDGQDSPRFSIGIPRVLNMYEEYPFWHTLFTACGIKVILSGNSEVKGYERCARMVMSDNICFPAKLVHSHIDDLIKKGADRIFMPFVIHEKNSNEQNSYNCPVVTGYSAVVKSVQQSSVSIDSPAISFKNRKLLLKQCTEYLSGLGISAKTVKTAFEQAEKEMEKYDCEMAEYNKGILEEARKSGRMTILLAGRPYHSDPLIQHDAAEMIADLGVDVITDDIVRGSDIETNEVNFIAQWAYPNRILKAAAWCAQQGNDMQFVQMTSFGCGPDAFLTDEVRDLLMRHRKSLTLLKLDDISNIGSMKLRVRSLIESLKLKNEESASRKKLQTEDKETSVFDGKNSHKKILVPFFTPFISPLIPAIMHVAGYDVVNLPLSDGQSSEWGLRFANNEVCYPATLIVGDVVKAFKSGKYNPDDCAVAITQTGGQCRASNYVALIKKALSDAGYKDVPVISLTFGESLGNTQPGFKINWIKILPVALRAVLYSDCISKFYYASAVREKKKGMALRLKNKYLEKAAELIMKSQSSKLSVLLKKAAGEFNGICRDNDCPKVGVVGEIFLKFNPFSHKNVIEWLTDQGVEVVPPIITDFFVQAFVNKKVNIKTHIEDRKLSDFIYKLGYDIVKRQIAKANTIASEFKYFIPFGDIFAEAAEAHKIITLNAQFGEGWLLPGEIMSFAANGVRNVISLQPFGCIANHIVSKGIEKRIKHFYPDINILSLDFDSGVSDVNVTNRMLLFLDNLKESWKEASGL